MKYCLILTVILNLFTVFSTNYIDFELDGKMNKEAKLNFSIFIKKFEGLLLYGVDQDSKLLIDAEEKLKEKILHIYFNNFSATEKCINLCGIRDCSNNYMTFSLKFDKSIAKIKCNGYSTTLAIDRINNKNAFNGFPLPTLSSKSNNTTYIWMGNIGPYIGPNFMEYHALRNQLIGCLDRIYYNNQIFHFNKKENKFFSTCTNLYNETICNRRHCDKKSISYSVSDCTISSLNMKYCTRALYPYFDNRTVFVLEFMQAKPIVLRLNWIPNTSKNLCLLEIKLRNKSLILFHTTDFNHLLKNVNTNEDKYASITISGKLTLNVTNSLIIYFNATQIIIKFSDGRDIYTFIEDINTEPELIYVGMSKQRNRCKSYKGLLDIQYNPNQLKKRMVGDASLNDTVFQIKNKEEIVKISVMKLFSAGIAVAIIFLLFLVLFYAIIRREIKSHFPGDQPKSLFQLTAFAQNQHNPNDICHLSHGSENATNIYDTDSTYTTFHEGDGYEIIDTND